MKQAFIFSNPSKVHDLRSLQSPSAVVPEPPSSPTPTAATTHPRTVAGNTEHHAGAGTTAAGASHASKSSVLQAASREYPTPAVANEYAARAPRAQALTGEPQEHAPVPLRQHTVARGADAVAALDPDRRRGDALQKETRAQHQHEELQRVDSQPRVPRVRLQAPGRGGGQERVLSVGHHAARAVESTLGPLDRTHHLLQRRAHSLPNRLWHRRRGTIRVAVLVYYWEQVLNYAFDASVAVDVLFNFFTGFYDADISIHELPKIRERYLKSWFLFDLVSTIPFDQFLQVVSSASSSLLTLKLLRTIRLFRLLKLKRLLRLKRAIETIQMDALNAHVLQTLKSLLMIVFIIHLVSCGWYLFYTWDPTAMNWVTNLNKDGLAYPYLVSFYWVSNTMMSVGYGDIYGVTDGERIYSIFVECLGSICVGMIIANIQMLTENYNPRGIKLKQKLQETKEFLLKRNIPRRLRQRVLSQFEYHWSHRTVFDEDKLLHQFP